jgi:hypothetical protein
VYLRKYGLSVLSNGYNITPIVKGSKAPGINYPAKKWSEIEATPARLQKWFDNGAGDNGIGILTKTTPAVDIDCQDDALTRKMIEFVITRLGETIERIGLAPKTLLVYRTKKPFPKVNSDTFIDDSGRTAKCEILGDGQQFVALAIHPDTRKPYRWKNKKGVHDTPVADLPEITHEDAKAIRDYFDKLARERGWREKKTLKRLGSGTVDRDDPFIHDAPKVDLNASDLRGRLLMVPNAEDYETWLQVGMGLYHQFEGDQEGLDLWHEWSGEAHNYDGPALDAKWGSFDVEGKHRAPTTARIILKLAQAEETRIITEQLEESIESINSAPTLERLKAACQPIKLIAFDKPTREMIAGKVKARYKDITDVNLTPTMAREMVRYENPENRNAPFWLEGFVYVQADETFYNTRTRQSLSTKGFDQSFARHMLTKKDQLEGKSTPDHVASHVALNVCRIPVVSNRMYMPGEGELFSIDDVPYVNSYSELGVPLLPETYSLSAKMAIKRVEKHVRHLFRSVRDGNILLDWIAYVVQTNNRVNWAPLLQGTQGDGKTYFYALLAAILGKDNVIVINGKRLEEHFNPWAEGHMIVFIEEIRLHGKNRWDAVNNLKPNLTNLMVEIRRMRTDVYNVINRSSYMLTSNSRDGLPVDPSDTRYFPLFSRWQSKESIDAFKRENPEYYSDLYATLHEAGALRKWFLEREIDPDFSAAARAPLSSYRAEMIELVKTEENEALEDALRENGSLDFCDQLMDASLVSEKLVGHGAAAPYGLAKKRMLSDAGFTYLGAMTVGGKTRKFWSKRPEMFQDEDGKVDTSKVRSWLSDSL